VGHLDRLTATSTPSAGVSVGDAGTRRRRKLGRGAWRELYGQLQEETGVERVFRESYSLNLFWPVSCALMLGFLNIQPLSADKVSDADTIVSSPQVADGNPVQSTSPTQIRISAIVFMPTLPRTRFPPSTSTENPYDPPREYMLGTSYVPYAPDD